MEHVVFFPAPGGTPAFRRFAGIEDAVRFVEHLRNVENVSSASVYSLTEVPLSFKAWYRVEVPGDLTLAGLHEVIQTVFEWEGSHLHVFETPLGEFGDGDVALGHRHDGEVTVDQVLQGNARIGYVYDYGDYWEHVIRVESVKESEPGTVYPRCIGGRRAAPPEDCGGIARYQESLRRHGDAGADVFDLAELDRRLHDGWHHPS